MTMCYFHEYWRKIGSSVSQFQNMKLFINSTTKSLRVFLFYSSYRTKSVLPQYQKHQSNQQTAQKTGMSFRTEMEFFQQFKIINLTSLLFQQIMHVHKNLTNTNTETARQGLRKLCSIKALIIMTIIQKDNSIQKTSSTNQRTSQLKNVKILILINGELNIDNSFKKQHPQQFHPIHMNPTQQQPISFTLITAFTYQYSIRRQPFQSKSTNCYDLSTNGEFNPKELVH